MPRQARGRDPGSPGGPCHSHVPVRHSVPKRLRLFLHHRPRTASSVLHILLRALEATLREACPIVPGTASFGAVSFLLGFGSRLNPHPHFRLRVVPGLFHRVEDDTNQDPPIPETGPRFHEATAFAHELYEGLQHTVRSRVFRQLIELRFASIGGLAGHLLGALRAAATAAARPRRHDLERLIRCCARPPFALDRLQLVGARSDQVPYLLPKTQFEMAPGRSKSAAASHGTTRDSSLPTALAPIGPQDLVGPLGFLSPRGREGSVRGQRPRCPGLRWADCRGPPGAR